MNRAPLIAQIPAERFRSTDGSIPEIGDVVVLDQGFTFPDGRPGCLVYCMDQNGNLELEMPKRLRLSVTPQVKR